MKKTYPLLIPFITITVYGIVLNPTWGSLDYVNFKNFLHIYTVVFFF